MDRPRQGQQSRGPVDNSRSTSQSQARIRSHLQDEWSRTPFWHSFADVFRDGTLQLTPDQQAMLLSAVNSPHAQLPPTHNIKRRRLSSMDPGTPQSLQSDGRTDSCNEGSASSPRSLTSDSSDFYEPRTPPAIRQLHVNPQDIERRYSADGTLIPPRSRPAQGPLAARKILPKPRPSIRTAQPITLAGHNCIVIPMHSDDSDDDYY